MGAERQLRVSRSKCGERAVVNRPFILHVEALLLPKAHDAPKVTPRTAYGSCWCAGDRRPCAEQITSMTHVIHAYLLLSRPLSWICYLRLQTCSTIALRLRSETAAGRRLSNIRPATPTTQVVRPISSCGWASSRRPMALLDTRSTYLIRSDVVEDRAPFSGLLAGWAVPTGAPAC